MKLEINGKNGGEVIRVLNNPTRRKILGICKDVETSQGSLCHLLGISRSSISLHLSKLNAVGLVSIRVDSKNKMRKYVKTIYDEFQIKILSPSLYESD